MEGKEKNISFLFHMYQPPWQYPEVLKRIADECYFPVTEWLSENRSFKVTLNANYSGIELLVKNNLHKIIENIGKGIEKGNIELTGSAAYHPILPLLPRKEIIWQIELNSKKNKEIFGKLWEPKGFFPPEMAYSPELAEIVKQTGYKWIIADDIAFLPDRNIPDNYILSLKKLFHFFRNSLWSDKFSFKNPSQGKTNAEEFIKELNSDMKENSYRILAFDIETIGHHQNYNKDTLNYLEKTIGDLGMNSVFISSLIDKFPVISVGKASSSSWSTSEEDMKKNIPFPLWNHPDNKIHEIQWQLIYHAMNIVEKSRGDKNYEIARELLDKGLNSCQFWWAAPENMNRKDFKPEYILDASKPVYDSIMFLSKISELDKTKAEQFYQELKQEVFHH